ncbi:MAG: PAS domain-containing sensor histidine kinase [Betaproteobacteria bacterium]|nr:PAS domain-containing sensor histidine kinase [Betaproteobacteria bacterium]
MTLPPPDPADRRRRPESLLAGLDLLGSAAVVLDPHGAIVFINQAGEQLFEVSNRLIRGQNFARLFVNGGIIDSLVLDACRAAFGHKHQELVLERTGREPLELSSTAAALDSPLGVLLLEFRPIAQRLRQERESKLLDSAQANRELVRNLAHEIKNPLGGLRGAAQLLETELPSPALREYTQVIIKEADRLQALVDRLLAPHRHARVVQPMNIHEVFERVRSVVQAEYGPSLVFERDYDASLPEFRGDKEQLIQVVMNIVRNAALALAGAGRIILRSRISRQTVIGGRRHKLALDLHVIDNGPGIPEAIRDRIFFPLVSGREGGSGLGLSLAQSFVQQHGGVIECESRPGRTEFRILLPIV